MHDAQLGHGALAQKQIDPAQYLSRLVLDQRRRGAIDTDLQAGRTAAARFGQFYRLGSPRQGVADNTMVIYIFGDNGSSAEGQRGSIPPPGREGLGADPEAIFEGFEEARDIAPHRRRRLTGRAGAETTQNFGRLGGVGQGAASHGSGG